MHTFGETGAGVPAFLAKLWRLVDDPETNNLICWSKDGRSFIIQNQAQFARELLPLNYKHNNMASFIRQLNMYGFHKITSIDNGGLKFDRDEMEFSHPCFKRNCPYLLEHIKRKIANTKTNDEKAMLKPEAVSKVLQDVRAMRGRQDSLDSRFSLMKQENEALWREIASLRQKHAKQQQIVNKLIQFLITIVQPQRNMTGVKRHMQLMINDTPESVDFRKKSESESEQNGPVIHELGEELLDEVADADSDLMDPISPYARSNATHFGGESPSPLHMERPHSSISVCSQNYDYSNLSAEDAIAAAGQSNGGGAATTNNINQQRNPSPNGVGCGVRATTPGSLVQTVNPDGSKIVYHVTEVLEAQPNESAATATATGGANVGGQATAAAAAAYNEENVLTTPMARSHMLKQRNKQRRQQLTNSPSPSSSCPSSANQFQTLASKVMRLSPQPQPQQAQPQQKKQPQFKQHDDGGGVTVKLEPNLDPMLFLNTYDESRGALTPDPSLISPNLSEESSTQSSGKYGANMPLLKASPIPSSSGTNSDSSGGIIQIPRNLNSATPTNMYNTGDFITENMPNDLFDESSLISAGGENSNFSENFSNLNEPQQQQQQQFGQSAASKGGKLSAFVAGGNNNNTTNNNVNNEQNGKNNESINSVGGASTSSSSISAANRSAIAQNPASSSSSSSLPSTSTAAAAAAATATATATGVINAETTNNGRSNANIIKCEPNMAVTKYNKNEENGGNQNNMRLSTADDVHGHIDSVQDELDSLKELLRGDGYSLDASTLMNNGQTAGGATNNNGYYAVDTDFINKNDQTDVQSGYNDARSSLDIGLLNKILQIEAQAGSNEAQQVLELGLLNKLFNDSEVLGPYGLSIYSDLPVISNEAKGSELMAYQPVYDLSDILDKSDLDADTDTMSAPSTSRQLSTVSPNLSVLNTPYHE